MTHDDSANAIRALVVEKKKPRANARGPRFYYCCRHDGQGLPLTDVNVVLKRVRVTPW